MTLFNDLTTDASMDQKIFVVEFCNANEKVFVVVVIDVDSNDDVSGSGGVRQYPRSPLDVTQDDKNEVEVSTDPL